VTRARSELVVGGFAAHVFVDEIDADVVALRDEDAHHLFRVRRLQIGERVSAGDGAGRWRPCVVQPGGSGGSDGSGRSGGLIGSGGSGRLLALAAAGPVVAEPRPEPPITIGFAVVKGERPESVVQKLTEAGADRIIPVVTDRSVVQWTDAEAARHAAKLDRVAREAAMQCRRGWLPDVARMTPFSDVVAQFPSGGLALAAADGASPSLACPAVLIGPEGGWSVTELSVALPRVTLGELVYRSETAAVVAAGLLGALRGEVVAERRERAYPESRRQSGG
jgi:16S rRNA (uracil1498-N3)-methyltransferase